MTTTTYVFGSCPTKADLNQLHAGEALLKALRILEESDRMADQAHHAISRLGRTLRHEPHVEDEKHWRAEARRSLELAIREADRANEYFAYAFNLLAEEA